MGTAKESKRMKMKLLRIKDNSILPKSDFSCVQSVVGKIADKTLSGLEKEGIFIFPEMVRDSLDIEEDQMILQSHNGFYRTSNVMGFVGYGNEQLVIDSRFSFGEKDYFFYYLLEKVMGFPNIVDMSINADRESLLLDLMVFLFPRYLKEALRKGPFKTYIWRQYNDSSVKGSIDIPRHIVENTPFVGDVAYNQREYSYDNDLTELVRHTIEFIRRKEYGKLLLASVKEEIALIVNATPTYEASHRQKIVFSNLKKTVRHAYYREYRNLQILCLLILRHQKHQISSGSRQIYGLLFDGAWLWEEYIYLLVTDLFYHPMNKAGIGGQRLFSKNRGLIYPDFISRSEENRVIADAKYKPVENIRNKDYLQVLAYMLRFSAQKGFYFYPSNKDGEQEHQLWVNKGSTYEENVEPRGDLCLVKHGLNIPECNGSYKEFSFEMEKAEKSFKSKLYAYINE